MSTLIRRATVADCKTIASIGRIAVEESHRDSCSAADMNLFLDTHYMMLPSMMN